jgi:hypothetical protein
MEILTELTNEQMLGLINEHRVRCGYEPQGLESFQTKSALAVELSCIHEIAQYVVLTRS